MVVSLVILLAGCKDRTITSYRAPKDAPVTAQPPAAAPTDTNNLPPGHPPIGDGAQAAAPSGPAAGADGMAAMAATAVPTASDAGGLTWTAPSAWTAKPRGSMRKGSYAVKGDAGEADLSITAFPGAVGGLEANLNRWRGQVGLAPLAEGEAAAATTRLTVGELGFTIVDLVSNAAAPRRILGAMAPRDGAMWFFKLSGPDSVVAAHRAEFLDFLRSVHPAAAAVP